MSYEVPAIQQTEMECCHVATNKHSSGIRVILGGNQAPKTLVHFCLTALIELCETDPLHIVSVILCPLVSCMSSVIWGFRFPIAITRHRNFLWEGPRFNLAALIARTEHLFHRKLGKIFASFRDLVKFVWQPIAT